MTSHCNSVLQNHRKSFEQFWSFESSWHQHHTEISQVSKWFQNANTGCCLGSCVCSDSLWETEVQPVMYWMPYKSTAVSLCISLLNFQEGVTLYLMVLVWWLLMCQPILCFGLWPTLASFLFHLAHSQLSGVTLRKRCEGFFMLHALPLQAQEYRPHDYYTTSPAAETDICESALVLSPCQMARCWGSSTWRGGMNVLSSMFVCSFPLPVDCARTQSRHQHS